MKKFVLCMAILISTVLSACSTDTMQTEQQSLSAPVSTTEMEKPLETFSSEEGKKVTFEAIPDDYFAEIDNKGRLERINYESESGSKYAYVYLPYGYDENDSEQKYDILYLMHGGGGSADTYMGSDSNPNTFKNVIDHMIDNKDVEPLILVMPSFYPTGDSDSSVSNAAQLTEKFHEELVGELIPAVEGKYHTYAESTDIQGLQSSRKHRAFGGFSMGSVTTWYTFIYCLDYFHTFLPASGDCWVMGQMGGNAYSEETAEYLANAAIRSGYSKDDFRIYAATGTEDIAYENLSKQVDAMKSYTDTFEYSTSLGQGNFYFNLAEGGVHTMAAAYNYVYDGLLAMYPG